MTQQRQLSPRRQLQHESDRDTDSCPSSPDRPISRAVVAPSSAAHKRATCKYVLCECAAMCCMCMSRNGSALVLMHMRRVTQCYVVAVQWHLVAVLLDCRACASAQTST